MTTVCRFLGVFSNDGSTAGVGSANSCSSCAFDGAADAAAEDSMRRLSRCASA